MEKDAAFRSRSFQNLGLPPSAGQPDKIQFIKIVITHTDLRLYWPARIMALQKSLEERGDSLHVVEIAGAGSPYAFAAKSNLSVRDVQWSILFPADRMEAIPPDRACGRLMAALDLLNPDLVMAGGIAFPSGATAVHWARTRHKAVVIFDDARTKDVPRNALVNYIKRMIYKQVDAILCPAPPWQRDFLYWGFRQEQIFFGVDVVDNEFWAKNYKNTAHIPCFLAVGRLITVKNFPVLLEAYRQYLEAIPPPEIIPLQIVGDGPERSRLQTFIDQHAMDQYVRILPFMQPEQLRTHYQQASALILASHAETWGLVVNEAMAAGLPVIVSQACGCAQILVQEGINGFCFAPDDPGQLAAQMIKFTKLKPAQKASMGIASRQLVQSWGLERFAQGSLQAIDYAFNHRAPQTSLPARILLRHWKGRYRPV